jgi:hypothetical protein
LAWTKEAQLLELSPELKTWLLKRTRVLHRIFWFFKHDLQINKTGPANQKFKFGNTSKLRVDCENFAAC